jgi:hypothetical protein
MTGSNRRLLRDLFAAPLGFHNAPPLDRRTNEGLIPCFRLVPFWASYMPVMILGYRLFFRKNAKIRGDVLTVMGLSTRWREEFSHPMKHAVSESLHNIARVAWRQKSNGPFGG